MNSPVNVGSGGHSSRERSPSLTTCSAISVAEGYKRWARTYDRDPNPLLAREERYLAPLFAGLSAKKVLDVACGTGRWLEQLTAQGWSGVGIDRSHAMLRAASKKDAIAPWLSQADCALLPVRTASFDLAICSFALAHVVELKTTILELARVLKPRADLFISDLHSEAYACGWRVGFRDETASVQIETIPRTAEQIVCAFCDSGFDCLKCTPLFLGDPEKPIFERAKKLHIFEETCQVPAVLIGHFKRVSP